MLAAMTRMTYSQRWMVVWQHHQGRTTAFIAHSLRRNIPLVRMRVGRYQRTAAVQQSSRPRRGRARALVATASERCI
jgi:hypothetical protein